MVIIKCLKMLYILERVYARHISRFSSDDYYQTLYAWPCMKRFLCIKHESRSRNIYFDNIQKLSCIAASVTLIIMAISLFDKRNFIDHNPHQHKCILSLDTYYLTKIVLSLTTLIVATQHSFYRPAYIHI